MSACLLVVLTLALLPSSVVAFSATTKSPWAPASWRLVINLGREISTTMPEEWGASGARLSFPVELCIESDRLPDEEQDELLGGRGANRLRVVDPEKITYITTELGEQQVPLKGTGGWNLRLGRKPGHASLLRFWLDTGVSTSHSKVIAQKRDVTLQANQRLYFAAHCWRQSDWVKGRQKLQPTLEAYERAQAKLEDQVSHESGDRRLDGVDPLETLAAYKDMAGLTLDRDDKLRQLLDAQEYLPPPENLPLGNWPGSTELMALAPMEIFVQEKKGFLGNQQEYHLLGSWNAKPFNVIPEDIEDEYEYYDDEEEEEEGEDMDEDFSEEDEEDEIEELSQDISEEKLEKEANRNSPDSMGGTTMVGGSQEQTK
ncbi:expressed unknown protein [Seminavis robusta]|uniref:Uncharacterized protein n=1 Tax=Seminavis robusta TaxID=568900 RepID=A0A9N8H668_9STRA|nr:expressed unknown protein [Seminavis robusta]|eukprot:Sro136_g064150.1 n/a (372) ;mRNA; f:66843-67958